MTPTVAPEAPSPVVAPRRLRDRLLHLAELATTPLMPSDYLDIVNPLRTGADLRGRIEAIRPETRDAVTVVIRPGQDWRRHIPGQYVRVGIAVDGVRQWRAYSLTSALDRPDGCIAVTVKAIPDGTVSNYLVKQAKVGTVVNLDQATGEFTLPSARPAKIAFITAGSGITPVMGMLRNAIDDLSDVVLVHSAPAPDDVIFGAELRDLAGHDRIRLLERHTDTDGLLDVAELTELVPDLRDRETWACGPTGLLDALEETYEAGGFAHRLHTERFRPAIVATGDGGAVTFARSEAVVEADGATTLLDAGEAAGVLMPSGCRMGICFGCVLPLREGAVRDLRNGALTTAAPGDDVAVQTCISAAAGSCELDH